MLNILITGSNGQLGSEFREASALYPYYNFIFTDIAELDITDAGQVEQFLSQQNIDVVINCAGYTAVDRAEEEPDLAILINRDAVVNLVQACKKYDIYLVHISTDYVFDGKNQRPYREDDKPHPTSSYGKSKLAGEEAVMACLEKGMIIRTAWLYSSFGSNFVKTILKKGSEKGKLDVVNDQVGCPTYARDLAVIILKILPKALSIHQFEIYHYSDEGECSWYDLAKAAVKLANIPCQVNPVTSEEYPQQAPRPFYSVLDKTKIKEQFGITIPDWRESLRECIALMA
ncbi:MAG: dTDP-4-dehydrorhamnose reductase [Bacteroidales bacterium]|nr:dTDP-4-dehydrorhamnose reductase [Bacteroidales bacterium]